MMKDLVNSDEELFLQIKNGSNDAFGILYQKHWNRAFADAYKRIRNRDQAKDIVQDIFLNIWQRRESLVIDNFPAYLTIAVRNQVLKLLEKEKHKHPFFDLLENLPGIVNMADTNILYKELAVSYDLLINSLPPKRRLIFKLRFQEDQSTKEIAEALSISRNTVQNQLGKAIEQLKVSLSHLFILIIVFLNKP
ncbi:MAG TPA: sigma-70 family RNA polymerase sigma factor [Flavitalea sp.]|nr:sigma-70 family RNA polymerase sigma factor [Flavitalea sp.]